MSYLIKKAFTLDFIIHSLKISFGGVILKFKDNITGILVLNKPKGITSRDAVNKVQYLLNTKVGHTGTLDPLATGVLVLTLGRATKISEIITSETKEYIAECVFGIETDTLDSEGKILKEEDVSLKEEDVKTVLNGFKKTYSQEVPKYSAVKINGKKLYEYAREGAFIDLPKRDVTIYDIKLLEYSKKGIKFYVKVSKGTYIRSLIRDISYELGTVGIMTNLIRISQGKFKIENAFTLEDIENNNYKILSIRDALDIKIEMVDDVKRKKILNGVSFEGKEDVLFVDNEDRELAIYKSNNGKLKMWKMIYKNN